MKKIICFLLLLIHGVCLSAQQIPNSEISGDELSRTDEINWANLLVGRVAGVDVLHSSGVMDGTAQIFIRGINFVHGGSQPLFVVDGIPLPYVVDNLGYSFHFNNAVGNIGNLDIENISILKGPAAAVCYGWQAASGAILITTKNKSAKKGFEISARSGIGFEQVLSKTFHTQITALPQTGVVFTNNVNLIHTGKSSYVRVSYTNTDLSGYMLNSAVQRNAITVNANSKVNKRIELYASAGYTNNYTKGRSVSQYEDHENDITNNFWGTVGMNVTLVDGLILKTGIYGTYADFSRTDRYDLYQTADTLEWKNVNQNIEVLLSYSKQIKRFSFVTDFGMNYETWSWKQSKMESGIGAYSYNGDRETKKIYRLFGKATAGFNNTLFVEVALRNEKYNQVTNGDNTYLHKSVGGNFVFSELFNPASWFTYGKLYTQWSSATVFEILFPRQYLFENYGYDPYIEPSKISSLEAGIAMRFLKNRIGIELAYYKSYTSKMVIPLLMPSLSGLPQFTYTNYADMSNKGIELSVNATPVQRKNGLSWNVALTFSTNRNSIERIGDDDRDLSNDGVMLFKKGEPYGMFFDQKYSSAVQDRKLVNPYPDWMAGLNNNFSFKSFDLGILCDIRHGEIYTTSSYAKIREVTLNYSFPKQWIGRISALRVGAYGRNLFTWGNVKHFGHNINLTYYENIEDSALPAIRNFGINLTVSF